MREHSRDATASEFLFTRHESFCLRRKRGLHWPPPNEGGGAPNGAPRVAAPDKQAQPRPYASRSPFGAPPRLCAGIFRSQLGLGRASWNHRVKGGPLADASAVSTSQPDHAPDGSMPKPPADKSD
jgi:hypothetical protein